MAPARPKEVAMSPTYELHLRGDEDPEPSSTGSIILEPGSELFIQCDADENFPDSGLKLERNSEEVKEAKKETRRRVFHIKSYTPALHSGFYNCEAKSTDGVFHQRQLRIYGRGIIPDDPIPCPPEEIEKCGSNAQCAMQMGMPTCFCDPDYHGARCDNYLLREDIKNRLEVAAGASGSFMVGTIILTVFFALLYMRERKHRRQLVSFYGPLPTKNAYGDIPTPLPGWKSPFDDSSTTSPRAPQIRPQPPPPPLQPLRLVPDRPDVQSRVENEKQPLVLQSHPTR